MNRDKRMSIGLFFLTLFILVSLFAPWLSPFDPLQQSLSEGLAPPSAAHWLGQDKLGRDILSRIVYGARISLSVGVMTVSVSLSIVLAIGFAAVLGPSLRNVILALSLMGWVGYARLIRGQLLVTREEEYVAAARALGAGSFRLIVRHLLPNILAPVIVEATFGMAGAIVTEASLSFLGLGVQPPTPSWGSMLSDGRSFLLLAPHLTAF